MGLTPYLQDEDFTLYHGDALETLRELPDESVHMCVTSPPFYGLRDYQCEGQIGLESTPDEWVAALVAVFREVRRVLRSDGTLWVEVGDSYAGSWGAQSRERLTEEGAAADPTECHRQPSSVSLVYSERLGHPIPAESISANQIQAHPKGTRTGSIPDGAPFKPKDLIGAPWLLAFALRADGWYLRSEIIWSKPNPMPESVTDRPTTSHSRVFLLTKSARYFYDAEAIREPHQYDGRTKLVHDHAVNGSHENYANMGTAQERWPNAGRNRRSVWTIATQPYPEAHFATWPEKLVEPMILAGTSERGVCPECGAPWQRIVDAQVVDVPGGSKHGAGTNTKGVAGGGRVNERAQLLTQTTGWQPGCECGDEEGVIGQPGTVAHDPVPAVVLDPFMGSGTTALVARRLGRRAVGVELSESYCAMAARRTRQLSLLATEGTES